MRELMARRLLVALGNLLGIKQPGLRHILVGFPLVKVEADLYRSLKVLPGCFVIRGTPRIGETVVADAAEFALFRFVQRKDRFAVRQRFEHRESARSPRT